MEMRQTRSKIKSHETSSISETKLISKHPVGNARKFPLLGVNSYAKYLNLEKNQPSLSLSSGEGRKEEKRKNRNKKEKRIGAILTER